MLARQRGRSEAGGGAADEGQDDEQNRRDALQRARAPGGRGDTADGSI
jgi:hypothetical protein